MDEGVPAGTNVAIERHVARVTGEADTQRRVHRQSPTHRTSQAESKVPGL